MTTGIILKSLRSCFSADWKHEKLKQCNDFANALKFNVFFVVARLVSPDRKLAIMYHNYHCTMMHTGNFFEMTLHEGNCGKAGSSFFYSELSDLSFCYRLRQVTRFRFSIPCVFTSKWRTRSGVLCIRYPESS